MKDSSENTIVYLWPYTCERFCNVKNEIRLWALFVLGLTLIFYTQNDEFLEGISQGYGMRLQIHEPGTFPMPDQEGIFLSSSFETHIGLRLVRASLFDVTFNCCRFVVVRTPLYFTSFALLDGHHTYNSTSQRM